MNVTFNCKCGCGMPVAVGRRFAARGHNSRLVVRPSLLQKFESHIERISESGCWLWTGALEKAGYGTLSIRKDKVLSRAHRISWTLFKGPIPEGLSVLHRCDVRCCVNPNHLFLGTHADNTADMMQKGRGKWMPSPGERNGRAKVTNIIVQEIRAQREAGMSYAALARRYDIGANTVRDIALGKSWRHL